MEFLGLWVMQMAMVLSVVIGALGSGISLGFGAVKNAVKSNLRFTLIPPLTLLSYIFCFKRSLVKKS